MSSAAPSAAAPSAAKPLPCSTRVPSSQPLLPSGTRCSCAPSNLCSAVNRLNFSVHSSSVTGGSDFSRTACACLLLTNGRCQKTESNSVNKGKKSPADKGASLESLSVLLHCVRDTMNHCVRDGHDCMQYKYAIYAFLSKICQDLRADLAIKQRIDVSSSLDRDFRVESLKHRPNNISPRVVKPPTVQWLGLLEKVSAAVAVWL